jgi:hypothetical protein
MPNSGMIWKKYILTKLFILAGFVGVLAAPHQTSDELIYNGDTLSVYLYLSNEFYPTNKRITGAQEMVSSVNLLFGGQAACHPLSCWRGYKATWEIIEEQLYLTGIYSCCYYNDSIKADLTSLFKERVINGKVNVDWITTNTVVQGGEIIDTIAIFLSTAPIYENEFEFEFKEGKLLNIKNNPKSRKSIYSQDEEKLTDFIYSNIDWDNLPIPQKPVRVLVEFSTNEKGKVDCVEIRMSDNKIFTQEAIRVIKLIPDWDVFYDNKKFLRYWKTKYIIFSEENKEKYRKSKPNG